LSAKNLAHFLLRLQSSNITLSLLYKTDAFKQTQFNIPQISNTKYELEETAIMKKTSANDNNIEI